MKTITGSYDGITTRLDTDSGVGGLADSHRRHCPHQRNVSGAGIEGPLSEH
jgi:hypothetical protein